MLKPVSCTLVCTPRVGDIGFRHLVDKRVITSTVPHAYGDEWAITRPTADLTKCTPRVGDEWEIGQYRTINSEFTPRVGAEWEPHLEPPGVRLPHGLGMSGYWSEALESSGSVPHVYWG